MPGAKPDPAMVRLATQLIDRQTGRFDPADMEDRYEARLREVIQSKLRGEEQAPEPEPDNDRSNVVDLMAALKRSLGQATDKPKRTTAKKASSKTASAKGEKPKATAGTKRTPAAPSRKRA